LLKDESRLESSPNHLSKPCNTPPINHIYLRRVMKYLIIGTIVLFFFVLFPILAFFVIAFILLAIGSKI